MTPSLSGNVNVTSALRILFGQLSPARRRAVLPLFVLMLAGAVAELFAIGALLPFLAAIAAPESSPVLTAIQPLLTFVGATTSAEILYALTALFAMAALGAAVLRLILLWYSQKFVYGAAYEIGVKLYADTLAQPYAYHIGRNTSEIISSINKVQLVTGEVLAPLMYSAVAMVIACFIIAGLVAIDPIVAVASGAGFAVIYLITSITSRRRFRRNSFVISRAQGSRVQVMQEGLGGIRDVLIDRSQPVFVESYERAEAGLRDARVRNVFFANAPRFIVEGAGMVLIAIVAVAVAGRPAGVSGAIPVLGALALGAQRLLPLMQQIYAGWAQTMGNRQVLFDVVMLLRQSSSDGMPSNIVALPFKRAIRLVDVEFSYSADRVQALSGISLDIPKGARVGIAGRSGSGKSTLIDILIGLLEPTNGEVRIDGMRLADNNRAAWQKNIAHVPQTIFLADASLAENIAFGVRRKDIDWERVRRAAEQAELRTVIEALPDGYDTCIGERGIQLSGGQRQRIGIARALYKRASLLIFDEATSALDMETESAVMAAVQGLDRDLTVLLIAHRLSTLQGCDMVVRLENGRIVSTDGLPHENAITKSVGI